MKTLRAWGIALIVIGVAGLVLTSVFAPRPWGSSGDDGWRDGRGWHRGPMMRGPMRGFGREGMPGRGGPSGDWTGNRVLPPAANARTIDIMTTEGACEPTQVSVKPGEAVNLRFVNRGNGARYLVVRGQAIRIAARSGESITTGLKTDQQGEYAFFCGAIGRRVPGIAGRITVAP